MDLRLPITRPFACVNTARADKSWIDALQWHLSFHEGRAVSQVETMHVLIELAFADRGHPLLAGFSLPAFALEGREVEG